MVSEECVGGIHYTLSGSRENRAEECPGPTHFNIRLFVKRKK